MYRIFTLEEGGILKMLPDGPFATLDEVMSFGKNEVGGDWTVLRMYEDDPSRDFTPAEELGWMRVYYDGQYIGDTPVRNFECTDGSYGLIDHMAKAFDAAHPKYIDFVHELERRAMDLFKRDKFAMLRHLGYEVVYIPGDKQ